MQNSIINKIIANAEKNKNTATLLEAYRNSRDFVKNAPKRLLIPYRNFYLPYIEKKKNINDTSKLGELRGCDKGKSCIIIATGPSVRDEDIDRIISSGIDVVGVNSTVYLCRKKGLKIKHYIVQDPKVFDYSIDEINYANANAFVGDNTFQIILKDREPKLLFKPYYYKSTMPHWWNIWECDHPYPERYIELRDDIETRGIAKVRNVSTVALQLAIHFGYEKIYFYGQDCDHTNGFHFDENSNVELKVSNLMRFYAKSDANIIKCMDIFEKSLKEKNSNVKVYNATRGGKLESFERVDLDDVLDEYEKKEK